MRVEPERGERKRRRNMSGVKRKSKTVPSVSGVLGRQVCEEGPQTISLTEGTG